MRRDGNRGDDQHGVREVDRGREHEPRKAGVSHLYPDRGPREVPGLIDIRLVRLDDGTYLDVLRWESREAADAAIEKFAEVPEAGEIHGFVAEDLAHHRGEVVAG